MNENRPYICCLSSQARCSAYTVIEAVIPPAPRRLRLSVILSCDDSKIRFLTETNSRDPKKIAVRPALATAKRSADSTVLRAPPEPFSHLDSSKRLIQTTPIMINDFGLKGGRVGFSLTETHLFLWIRVLIQNSRHCWSKKRFTAWL